jgi:hypothetical protein
MNKEKMEHLRAQALIDRIRWGEDCEGMREDKYGVLPRDVEVVHNPPLLKITEDRL